MHIVAIPAYGADYKSAGQVKTAWEDGKDFLIQSYGFPETYFNSQDASELRKRGVNAVNIRFNNKRDTCVIKI